MRFPTRPVLVTIAIMLSLCGIILIGFWYQKSHCQAVTDSNGVEHPPTGDIVCDTMARPEALFSLALVVCTILSFGFISTQIAQSNASLVLAKEAILEARLANVAANRSAKAAEEAIAQAVVSNNHAAAALQITRDHEIQRVERERGTMAFWKIKYYPTTNSFGYCFVNMGAGPVIITEIVTGCAIIPINTPVDHLINGYRGSIYIPVPIGGFASSFHEDSIVKLIAGNGVEVPESYKTITSRNGHEVVLCIRLKYQARTEEVFISQAVIRVPDLRINDWAVDLGYPYTFEMSQKQSFKDIFLTVHDVVS